METQAPLPDELRSAFANGLSSANDDSSTPPTKNTTLSSRSPLLVAMVVVSFIMMGAFAGVFIVRRKSRRRLRSAYRADKHEEYRHRILEEDLDTGSSALSYHDLGDSDEICFTPVANETDYDAGDETSESEKSPLFRRTEEL